MIDEISQTLPRRKGVFVLKIVFLAVLMGFASALSTQYLAYSFEYSNALGNPFYGNIYWPWMAPMWALEWWPQRQETFYFSAVIFLTSISILFVFYLLIAMFISRKYKAMAGLHGTARWATKKEINASALIGNVGVFIGGWFDRKGKKLHYLRHNGPENILAFAPPRSGKGVGLVLPTLLTWPGSVICYDIKGENWALSSGWRKYSGNKVFKFDPTDENTACFNPLSEIRLNTVFEVGDAQNIATMLVDVDGKGLHDHWSKTAFSLLTAAILHCCYEQKNVHKAQSTLADVGTLLANPTMETEEVLTHMLTFQHLNDTPHSYIEQEARSLLNMSSRELSSVISTAISSLTLYRDPLIARATNRSDFRIKDLMNHDDPISLYIVVSPADAERLRPVIRLIITQILRRLTAKMEFSDGLTKIDYRHRLLLLLDEFPSLKRLPVIEEGLAFMAGYGIKAYLIAQDFQQIVSTYGREENISGTCQVRIAFAPNNITTADLLSKMTGTTTIIKKQISISGKRMGYALGHMSETSQEVQRPLLTADEILRLPSAKKDGHQKILEAGDMLIFIAGQSPIYGRQVLFFKDEVLTARAKVLPPTKKESIAMPLPKDFQED